MLYVCATGSGPHSEKEEKQVSSNLLAYFLWRRMWGIELHFLLTSQKFSEQSQEEWGQSAGALGALLEEEGGAPS